MANEKAKSITTIQKIVDFLGDRHVLVLEPTPNYRMSLKQFFSNLKVRQVKFCSNGTEALKELKSQPIGLFIAEWAGDKMNGLQFCREVRRLPEYDKVPFLLTSVENLRGDVVLATEIGVDAYLLKPFSYEDFRDQLAALCRERNFSNKLHVQLYLAEDLLERGDFEQSKKIFLELMQEYPQSARSRFGLAQIALKQKDRARAITFLKDAIQVNALYLDAHRELLEIYEAEENSHGIIFSARKLHEISPDNPRYSLVLAKEYLEISDLPQSEAFFRKTIRLSPRLAEAHKGLGNVYMINEDYEKAMASFLKALDIDNKDVGTLNSLGLLYVKKGQFEEGIRMYEIILRIQPSNARVMFNLGHAYERMSNYPAAEDCYHRALTFEPEYERPRAALARLKAARRQAS